MVLPSAEMMLLPRSGEPSRWRKVAQETTGLALACLASYERRKEEAFRPLAHPTLDGLLRMSDDCGVTQHSRFGAPDRSHGYCTDDNSRALSLMARLAGEGSLDAAGERLGLVGMSGNSEFPHLHFSVRLHGKPVDPFIGATVPAACDATKIRPGLWTTDAARALAYTPTAPITLGLASRVPPRAVADRAIPPAVEGATLPLLIWVDLIGAQDGDVQIFEIQGPDGALLHSQTLPVSKGGLSWFAFSGKRAPAAGWQKGRYVGSYILQRDGATIVQQRTFATIP